MIPKIIHYCWFGGKPLPKYAKRKIASWKLFFPDYEIREWNEGNYDVNFIPYTAKAYKEGKYAFVSDFARYWILFQEGGIYFDTDVEVIRSFEDIINKGPFLGIEKNDKIISINPGLGMGAKPKMEFYGKMIDFYSNLKIEDSSRIEPYLVSKTSQFLIENGFLQEDHLQLIDDIYIYPNDYFNPLNDYTGKITITPNTLSIHYYAKSWIKGYNPLRNYLTRKYHLLFSKILKLNT